MKNIDPFLEASLFGDVSYIRRVLDAGLDINAPYHFEVTVKTPKGCTITGEDGKVVLDKKGKPSRMLTIKRTETLLHTAIRENHVDMMVFLLDRGADVYAKDDKGFTPYELAESSTIGLSEKFKEHIPSNTENLKAD